jgi:hypothetical protein
VFDMVELSGPACLKTVLHFGISKEQLQKRSEEELLMENMEGERVENRIHINVL